MNNIILIGMPGTGKSTVGVVLAKYLGFDFLDADIYMAQRLGRTLPRIIEEDGVERFLELENESGKSINCQPYYAKYADLRSRCRRGVDSVVADIRAALEEKLSEA